LDPLWPVAVGVADIGHSRAQNKPQTWERLNDQAWQMLQSNINGSHQQQTTVYSEPTLCNTSGDSSSADQFTATSPEGLAQGTLTVKYVQGGGLAPDAGVADPNGPATDAIVGPAITPAPGCQASVASSSAPYGGYTAYSAPLATQRTFVGIGVVGIPYTLAGTDAILAARVWDVAPDGSQLLVTRGVYRLDLGYDAASGTVRLPLYGNDWIFQPGHSIRLDLQQSDNPTYRPGNPGATGVVTFGPPTLSLPIRDATNEVIAGA
ncbi:MAG TPA: CocE/NonD family hydrolase C-terminal non-catalytic domain-containing protein, partial [Candidatus Dormibacteraeota bacterium]|nr:CocE/NonD family hydrolase C-terminal non-catalytic domain-containing protein [Candidatus Dormibacteraeota bacterium]